MCHLPQISLRHIRDMRGLMATRYQGLNACDDHDHICNHIINWTNGQLIVLNYCSVFEL